MIGNEKKPAIHIENLSVQYGQTPAIAGVCLDVFPGEYLGIIGPNGGGKSTLLKAILGLVPPTCGSIEILGKPVMEGRRLVGYVPQFSNLNRYFPITVEEVVLTGRVRKGIAPFFRYDRDDMAVANEIMRTVSIDHLAKRNADQLSGGEFQKMLIARALATLPKILVLDEPTASVDITSREQIFSLLGDLSGELTIVLVTHDLLSVASHAGSMACLNQRLLYHGKPVLTSEITSQIFGCAINLEGDALECGLHKRNRQGGMA